MRPMASLAEERRGDPAVPEITPAQIREQLSLAVDRVMAEGSLHDPRSRRARGEAVARRSDRGDLSAARLSHDLAALPRQRAHRHRPHADRAAHLRHLQGPAGRAGAGRRPSTTPIACSISRSPPQRLPPGACRAARRRPPSRCRASPTFSAAKASSSARPPLPATARRHHPRALAYPAPPRRAAAGIGAGRRGIPAGDGLFDAARLWPQPSFRRRRSAAARSRSRSCRRSWDFRSRSARSKSPNARW